MMKDNQFQYQRSKKKGAAVSAANSLRIDIELVRHLARMAAERDYKSFLQTGKIPYNPQNIEEN